MKFSEFRTLGSIVDHMRTGPRISHRWLQVNSRSVPGCCCCYCLRAAGHSWNQPIFITIWIYAHIWSPPLHVRNELIPNLISLWFLADLFWPEARENIRGKSAQKWGYRSPVCQTMGLFAELFLFPSVRASTKAAETWPECMWESNWSTEGEDGDDAARLEQRQAQKLTYWTPCAACSSLVWPDDKTEVLRVGSQSQRLHTWTRLLIQLVTPCGACGSEASPLWR